MRRGCTGKVLLAVCAAAALLVAPARTGWAEGGGGSGQTSGSACGPAVSVVPEVVEAGADEKLMPSGVLDDVSGGVFANAFWPDPTRVPGSGPYPNSAGQPPLTRRDSPGTQSTGTSPFTIRSNFP